MSKALKTFIILNLAASIAIIVLGTLLFMEKELIKSRAILLRNSLGSIAQQLKWGDEIANFEVEDKQSQAFRMSRPNEHIQLSGFQDGIEDLTSFASARVGQVEGRFITLTNTQDELTQRKSDLAVLEGQLSDARARIVVLNDDIRQKQNELAQANSQIGTLRGEISGLETRLDGLNASMVNRNNQIATLEIDRDSAIEERNIMYDNYIRCKIGTEREGQTSGELRGTAASILEVNLDWEYVVIDKGSANKVKVGNIAYVHRGDTYVGKLQVTEMEPGLSIASIVPGSVAEGFTIEAGDSIFF